MRRTSSRQTTRSDSPATLREAELELVEDTEAQVPATVGVVATRYGRREWILRRLLACSDCLAAITSLAFAGLVVGRSDLAAFLGLGALVLPGWLLLIRSYGLYDRDPKRISCSTIDDIPGVFHVMLIGTVLLWAYFRALPVSTFGLGELLLFAGACSVTMLLGRAGVRGQIRARGVRRAIVVGEGPTTNLLVRKLAAHREYGLTVIGKLATSSPSANGATKGASNGHSMGDNAVAVIGHVDELDAVIAGHDVDRLIVSAGDVNQRELTGLLRRCKQIGLRVSVLPQLFDVIGPSVEIDDVEGVTMLGLDPPVLSRSSRALKRAMDVTGSACALVVLAPLLLLIAVAIRLDSSGPVLFVQSRIGRDGRKLRVHKFRTMVRDAEERRAQLLDQSSDPDWLKLERDPRVTRVGRLLRTNSLDELPQLWTVLRGDMSLVGPRPLIEAEAERVVDWGRARLELTPGITGLWQVLGRADIPFDEMVKLDYLYVTNWTLWNDVRLLLRTLPAVVSRRGAN